jgi:transcriptional regulator with XRE-family HTH domain
VSLEELKQRRILLGFSQRELAKRIGVAQSLVSKAENGIHGIEIGLYFGMARNLGFLFVPCDDPKFREVLSGRRIAAAKNGARRS